ncbi:hypothetical protein RSAG8_11229, partial [Rhizoctonia solani AG-8 WAC10335]
MPAASIPTPIPSGKLSSVSYIDPREKELRILREVADDMKREAEEAEARLVQAESNFLEFIAAMEETYEDDAEGLAWFRLHHEEDKVVDLRIALAEAQTNFKAKAYKYEEEIEDLRRQIHAVDVRLEEMKKKAAKVDRENAIQTMEKVLGKRK